MVMKPLAKFSVLLQHTLHRVFYIEFNLRCIKYRGKRKHGWARVNITFFLRLFEEALQSQNFREPYLVFRRQMSAFSEKRRFNRISVNFRFWHKPTFTLLVRLLQILVRPTALSFKNQHKPFIQIKTSRTRITSFITMKVLFSAVIQTSLLWAKHTL